MTKPTAPSSGTQKPALTGKQKARRGHVGGIGMFAALLILTTACGSGTGTTSPAGSSTSAASSTPSAETTAAASATPNPTASSPSPHAATPAAIPTKPIATTPAAPAYTPPAPAPTTQAPQPAPTTAQAQSCHPLTNSGNCYTPGEFCRTSDHGATGIDANGDAIKCEDNNGWRWERV